MSVTSIQIKNPLVISRVKEEQDFGAGRNATECAENLIMEACELRRSLRLKNKDNNRNAVSVA
ncbi:MAG TPA: hypothetical protein VHX86_18675 [Tepidisphaeraceae bacterium]|jgi:hypothetical protein|nr:hypothetical protein [Tepidisphaeraceae bacterium]